MYVNCRAISFPLFSLLLLMLSTVSAAKIIYVDDDAVGLNDGASWDHAYTFLQEALADARLAEKPVEIRVAQGIYRPNEGLVAISEFDWRTTTFQLINGVTLKGGYGGLDEVDPNARDIAIYETILSGDLNGDDVENVYIEDPEFLLDEPSRAENSYHVITGSNTNGTAVLDGFTITGGNANSSSAYSNGAGLYNLSGSPTLSNCTFIGNSAWTGGGIYNHVSSPNITNCKFSVNSAIDGGGIWNSLYSNPVLKNCRFIGNLAYNGAGMDNNHYCHATLMNCTFTGISVNVGGGMNNDYSNPILTNCAFVGNSARDGAGMHNHRSHPVLMNCMFTGNKASIGGGMNNEYSSRPSLTSCTFSGNKAEIGNALMCDIYGHNPDDKYPCIIDLNNCIFWGEGNEIWNENGSTINIKYSNISNSQTTIYDPFGAVIWGDGNIHADPIFADSDNGDYHLKSEAGRWDPISEHWVVDDVTSPCVDAGDPDSPVAFEPFPNGERINMGAYGGTDQASKSPSGLHARYGGGSGEPNSPYLIYTAEQMNTIGLHAEDRNRHFKLMADIDLGGLGPRDFNIIGRFPNYFRGVFDGNGHTISNFTYISTDVDDVALFSYVEGAQAEIRDLGLIDPFIDAGMVNPIFEEIRVEGNSAASLVNYLWSGIVVRCYVRGGSISADMITGGFVAYNKQGTIADCSSTANVSGFVDIGGLVGSNYKGSIVNCHTVSAVTGDWGVGGLVGSNEGIIQDSSAVGEIVGETNVGGLVGTSGNFEMIQSSFSSGSVSGVEGVGGLVGSSRCEIANCYSTCSVSGGHNVGGLVGFHKGVITNCYSTGHVVFEPNENFGDYIPNVGGLLGKATDTNDVLQSFWDIETSGQMVSAGGMGLTTVEMQTPSTFLEAGWDFRGEADNGTDDIWWIVEGQDYPHLWWELTSEN